MKVTERTATCSTIDIKQSRGRRLRVAKEVKFYNITDECHIERRMALEAMECGRKTGHKIKVRGGTMYSIVGNNHKRYFTEISRFSMMKDLIDALKSGYTIRVKDKEWSIQDV